MSWVSYALALGVAHETHRYELQVQFDNEDGEHGKAWWVWSNQKSRKAIERLKRALETPGNYQAKVQGYPDGLICRIVIVTESRRLADDPFFTKQEDIPDVVKLPAERAFTARRQSNFLD